LFSMGHFVTDHYKAVIPLKKWGKKFKSKVENGNGEGTDKERTIG